MKEIKYKINWWELSKNENLHLRRTSLNYLQNKIHKKFGSLNKLNKKLNLGTALYNKIKYQSQGISIGLLKKILKELKMPFCNFSKDINGIGKYKALMNIEFPFKISPYWAELLAHSFFDGYADRYQFRYSNYDKTHREEFIMLINKIFKDEKIKFNNPINVKLSIDLPSVVVSFLSSFFNINSFHSKKCRLSKEFLEFVRENQIYGWYFLKGAFIDEGSITGDQIWIVRGIQNKKMAVDIMKLCKVLNLECRIQLTSRKGSSDYYSVGIKKESYSLFIPVILDIVWNKSKKILALEKKFGNYKAYKQREENFYEDCKKIFEFAKRNDCIKLEEAKSIINNYKTTVYSRLRVLLYCGALKRYKNKYTPIISELPKNLPSRRQAYAR